MSFLPQFGGWRNHYHLFRIRWAIVKRTFQLKRPLTSPEIQQITAQVLQESQILFAAVGTVAIAWAEIELQLDGINGMLILHPNIKDDRLPASLKPKIALFKKGFKEIPDLAGLQGEASSLLEELNRLRKIRHDIVHGVAFAQGEQGGRKLVRAMYAGKTMNFEYVTYQSPEITGAAIQMVAVRDRLHNLFRQTLRILFPDAAKQAFGEL